MFLGKTTTEALRSYLSQRGDDNDCLWMGRYGALTAQGIDRAVRRRARRAGVERVHPHLFRKTFATCWLDNGGDVERLRVIAGWRSWEMLPVYVRSALQQLSRAHQQAGPVDRIVCAEMV